MALEGAFFRPKTDSDEFEDISKRKRDPFLEKIQAEEARCTREHIHFCYPCAKADYNDKKDLIGKEMQRNSKAIPEAVKSMDLSQYSDPKRFKLLSKQNAMGEMKHMTGVKEVFLEGFNYDYLCLERGHRITVLVPPTKANEDKPKSKAKVEE